MKNLIIVESFTKTKTISKYLNNNYNVICSLGHINNLPHNELAIDTERWIGNYVITNKKALDNIKKHVRESDIIYIASDPDMEGEAIAFHIYQNIKGLLKGKTHYRITFNEISKNAITNAIENPRDIDYKVVEAQETRRFVDRLVGYKLSPLLWQNFQDNTLSVGRVQTIALLMCKQQLDKITNHNLDIYWRIFGEYLFEKTKFEFTLHHSENKKVVKECWDKAKEIVGNFGFLQTFKVNINETKRTQHPPAPYTTTTMQQDAYSKYRFSSKKTMSLAQQLYENGYITYMRTDSTHVSDQFKNVIIKFIEENYPNHSQFRKHKNKIANAQEAHEAVRVVDIYKSCDMTDDHNKLYKMIWSRTVASQMISAEYIDLCVHINYLHIKEYTLVHNKSLLVKKGYQIVYKQEEDGNVLDDVEKYIKYMNNLKPYKFRADASIDNVPSLYNEISLIKELEKHGIGRPSTYSTIIDKILTKKYVSRGENPSHKITSKNYILKKNVPEEKVIEIDTSNKKRDLLVPSELGINIIEYLKTKIPYLLDINFTANMESTLDKISDEKISKNNVLTDFYNNHILPVALKEQSNKVYHNKEDGIIKTKFGYCYYHKNENRYTNIESYLKWKNKGVEALSCNEIEFLKSLPKNIDSENVLHIGQYGLYLKCNGKNVRLDKNKWDLYLN